MSWIARNKDGKVMQFPFMPWMDTEKWKWCMTLEDGSQDYGTEVEDKYPDVTFEDRPKEIG